MQLDLFNTEQQNNEDTPLPFRYISPVSKNKDDRSLIELTNKLYDDPDNNILINEWHVICITCALKFANKMMKGQKIKRNVETVAHESVTRLWEQIFFKHIQVKKSITTMLYYCVEHFVKYKTKKDDEVSYEELLEKMYVNK